MIFDAPPNLPVEDILEKTAPAPTAPPPPLRRPTAPSMPLPPEAAAKIEEPRAGFKRIGMFVGIVVVILAVVGVVGWYTLTKLKSGDEETQKASNATPPPTVPETPVAPAPTVLPQPAVTPASPDPSRRGEAEVDASQGGPAAPVDTDSDGLTDEEEAGFGTDPAKADTDGDGLFDREELNFYRTDPKNPDTDGDGFSDGVEVRNNYNPLGPGRLGTIPTP